MDLTENRYWPFDVLPPEQQTDETRQQVQFLETAHRAGYTPYMFGSENFGATSGERAGEIIYRGFRGKHWEVNLVNACQLVLSAHVNSFQFAGESLMRWLRGGAVAEILEDLGGHLYKTAANPVGFVLQGGEREKGTKGDAKGSGAYNDPRSGG